MNAKNLLLSALFLFSSGIFGSASAQLLGTEKSFMDSGVCKQYGCKFLGKDLLGNNVSVYHYHIGPDPKVDEPYSYRFSITRFKNKIISGNFSYLAQDIIFHPKNNEIAMHISFIKELAGIAPSIHQLGNIEEKICGHTEEGGQPQITNLGQSYAISCMGFSFPDSVGAREAHFSIFKR